MSSEEPKSFRTVRGWIAGWEPDEETYFAYSATLRIFGNIVDLDDITQTLGIAPTHTHRRGERRRERYAPFEHDMWSFSPALPKDAPLEHHIDALWAALQPHKDYLLSLKRTLIVDVYLSYYSNCDHAGIEVPYTSLAMFIELQIPFGLSIGAA